MLRSLLLGIMALMVWTCSPVKEASKPPVILTQNSRDSTEYELLVFDPGFDQWYLLNYTPAQDRSDTYYRNKNIMAVWTWNDYYRSGKYFNVIDSYIDYRTDVDYGIEVNRKLFWYFKFIRNKYRIHLF